MAFLNFWRNETNESANLQLGLSEEPQPLPKPRKRVDGAVVFRRFTDSIKANGGDQDAYRRSIMTETSVLFGCSVRELYEGTGATFNRRETLPQEAQEAYMVNESLAANELERMEGTIGGESQKEVNSKIDAVVREQSKQTRKWLPW